IDSAQRCAVQIPGGVDSYARNWEVAVPAVVIKTMQNRLCPATASSRAQLEDRSGTVSTADIGCTVETTVRTNGQTAILGILPIGAASAKAVQYRFVLCARPLRCS